MIDGEPALDELLVDPIVQLLVAADRVDVDELARIMEQVRLMLRS